VSEKAFGCLVEMAVANVAAALVSRKGLSEKESLRQVYRSGFYGRLQNPKSGLYIESDAAQVDIFLTQFWDKDEIAEGT